MTKHKKHPKRPKVSASLATWERYSAKCKEVDKHNAQLDRDKKKKASLIKKHSA